MKFGTLIRAQRLRQNLSMDRVCSKIDLSKAYLSLIETGQKTPPKDEIVVQIARALGIDERDLLMRAHRERYPEDVLELRKIGTEMREALERLRESLKEHPKASEVVESAEEIDLTGDFLAEFSATANQSAAEAAAIRCAKVVRLALHELQKLIPPEMESASQLASELDDLRAEERDFLLHVIQGVKQLRPRRGPQNMVDD